VQSFEFTTQLLSEVRRVRDLILGHVTWMRRWHNASVHASHGFEQEYGNAEFLYSGAMTNRDLPAKRGRPPQSPVDTLFARLFIDAIKLASGLPNGAAIELDLEPERVRRYGHGVERPHKWDGYEAGRRAPTDVSVRKAEAKYPGTARAFYSPLRVLLRGEAVSAAWIHAELLSLPAPIVELLYEPASGEEAPLLLGQELRPFTDQRGQSLAQLGGLHALEAAVLLMRLGELMPSPQLRERAREAYIRTQPSVRAAPETARVADELFDCIDGNFPMWLYPRPDLRWEVTCSTTARRKGTPPPSPEIILAWEHMPTSRIRFYRIAIEERVLKGRLSKGSST